MHVANAQSFPARRGHRAWDGRANEVSAAPHSTLAAAVVAIIGGQFGEKVIRS